MVSKLIVVEAVAWSRPRPIRALEEPIRHGSGLLRAADLPSAGEGTVHATGAPVPGPVLGLILLAIGIAWRESRPDAAPLGSTALAGVANGLLGHLSLLFVPAAVGVVQQGGVLRSNGTAIAVALVASTVLTLAVTAAVFVWALRFASPPASSPSEAEPGRPGA